MRIRPRASHFRTLPRVPYAPPLGLTTWEQQLFGTMFGGFGLIALVLALSGVYGVVAWAVGRRRRKIGIRMALGARPDTVVGMVLRESAAPSMLGVAAGEVGALGLSRLMQGIVYGVAVLDPLALVVLPALLAGSALVASWVPARRASRADPVEALRGE